MPPSTNALFANARNGGRVRTKEYRRWSLEAGWLIRIARLPLILGNVGVEIVLGPRRKGADADNRIKALLDALVEYHVIQDDSLVDSVLCRWDDTVVGARVTVTPAVPFP